MISPPGLLIATLWLVAAGPKWLMMVSGIAHHYVMLIRGSNRQRFRIPGNFTARPQITGAGVVSSGALGPGIVPARFTTLPTPPVTYVRARLHLGINDRCIPCLGADKRYAHIKVDAR